MSLWYQFIFPAGLLLLAHSFFLALRIREQLQEHHHGSSSGVMASAYFPVSSSTAGALAHINASTIPIFVELMIGVVVAIVGFVKQSKFKRARIIDKNCHQRYDDVIFTGVGFMHFNHRGSAMGSRSGEAENGDASTLASKKKM
ncbi:hypothetical protein TraAM80_01125 [Trypanosoma rangeli]|uniref:Membrane magnesium transporter n=1 Tax=Trypanosoma rangeli TaxID=5698 RepID=A0A3S5ISH1_TRYRA|nr:uncharacterized protein TraAM80_01125 [Trypanosoma rangeli]RNF11193.1 hypothetical protein TraAM80_01125 [Trypanosoma rangeli]|eukprot:RNF11193.1 hypothetical protein TraAM80_01125 [Trypanosoma rangeli]